MFTLEGPHIVMSRTDAQNGLDFHFNKTLSIRKQIKCGVPQGSVLFLLYINDISNLTSFIIFADDTNLFYSDGKNMSSSNMRVASLRVASLRVASLRVASLRVASLRVASQRVCELRVCDLRVCELRVCEFTVGIYCLENAHLSVILCALTN